jgi:hypothetical protein
VTVKDDQLMNDFIGKLRECSRKKVYRLLEADQIKWDSMKEVFLWVEDNLVLEDLQLQKKHRGSMDEDSDDGFGGPVLAKEKEDGMLTEEVVVLEKDEKAL